MSSTIYRPREDSTLLEKYVRRYAFGSVLDVGTGSGIQAIAASKHKKVNSVLALDIQKEVIEHCKKSIKSKKIKLNEKEKFIYSLIKISDNIEIYLSGKNPKNLKQAKNEVNYFLRNTFPNKLVSKGYNFSNTILEFYSLLQIF